MPFMSVKNLTRFCDIFKLVKAKNKIYSLFSTVQDVSNVDHQPLYGQLFYGLLRY